MTDERVVPKYSVEQILTLQATTHIVGEMICNTLARANHRCMLKIISHV